ncbi:hypothetical protein Metev_0672 [Methanohalobium evestigatum Z-7303]|uniref:Uncharacterized protein n=1 Tax=Methanohalobium evestigatum (strain ATCC BAA-1072 / DSM 3721 / NBRC 107634 / OCM 161 / Z-7303) TaxID=644295 RepID=D7E6V4_METEZ|nr:hypothetical protein [Methanohalobium evestigatum]ADI73578.1 hypothetical protein Metev_0672 [Methanohalobium evestigatum Z-7303]
MNPIDIQEGSIIETSGYKRVYLINTSDIDSIRIPIWYLRDNRILLPERTHLLHETNDSFLLLDSFNVSVWIPKNVVEVVSGFE